ncbi:MAG: aldo/keto reductase [Clostridia bacterium]
MRKVLLGRTGIEATCQSFGVLPLQRTEMSEAVKILQRAYEGGINFYDTARAYSDSEEKIGNAFTPSMREKIFIATKSNKTTKDAVLEEIQTSLKLLKTDYVDILQAHNLKATIDVEDENSAYGALIEAKKRGYCRYIGITSHRAGVITEGIESGLYDTVQFPMSYLSDDSDLSIVKQAQDKNIGFIAMKALAGGAITSGKAAAAFMEAHPWILPIWGVQHMHEIEEFIEFGKNPPKLSDPDVAKIIETDRVELAGNFCRACGYCKPCTVCPDMEMNVTMRMPLNIKRAPVKNFITEHYQKQMKMIEECIDCGACKKRCPYGLDIPTVLRENLESYKETCSSLGIAF